jgi:hypothetical protein
MGTSHKEEGEETEVDTVRAMPHHHNPSGTPQGPSVSGLAALLTLGVIPWLYGVHAIALGEANTWAGHVAHATRDSLLAFPLAVLAVGAGRWLAIRWGIGETSSRDRLGQAALIALAFAVCLVPAVGMHQYLDWWLDGGSPTHVTHSHGLLIASEEGTGLVDLTLHGLRDALVGLAAAFPVTLLGLALASGRRGSRRVAGALQPTAWATPARLVVPAAAGLVFLGLVATALTFTLGEGADPDHASATHSLLVTVVPTSAVAEVGGLRVTTRSAIRRHWGHRDWPGVRR